MCLGARSNEGLNKEITVGVRKKGSKFEATWKWNDGSIVLGKWDCRHCAYRAIWIAERCVDTWNGNIHGTCHESINEAFQLGIKERLEEYFGFELSEAEAIKQDERRLQSIIEYKIEARGREELRRAKTRKELYNAKRLIKAIPTVTVKYPDIPIASVPATQDGTAIPESSGVYFVWYDDAVVYVGQSINLKQRATLSHGQIHEHDRISWIEFPEFVLNYAESYYIGIACPARNFGLRQKQHQERFEAKSEALVN